MTIAEVPQTDSIQSHPNFGAGLADLMRQAVEERRRRKRVAKAIDKILILRKRMWPVDDRTFSAARRQRRP
jgi:hypothetical protein